MITEYPKTLYKNVLLLDGKIINWKIGTTCWIDINYALNNRQPIIFFKQFHKLNFETKFISKKVYSTKENNEFFDDNEWFKQFEIHNEIKDSMFKPY